MPRQLRRNLTILSALAAVCWALATLGFVTRKSS